MRYNQGLISEGAYKIAQLQTTYQDLVDKGARIINCTIGDPVDDTPLLIRDALIKSFESQTNSQYPKYIGEESLRSAICDSLNAEYKIQLEPNINVVACNGTKEAIFSIPMLFDWSGNQQVLFPSLSYPIYQLSASYHAIKYKQLEVSKSTGFLPDLSRISSKTFEETQLFWMNSPHNPTSAIASKDYLKELIRLAEKYNFIICSDECYNDLYYDEKPASILDFDSNHWICFRSLSKRSHMTGYRSGAIISKNTELMNLLKKMRAPWVLALLHLYRRQQRLHGMIPIMLLIIG